MKNTMKSSTETDEKGIKTYYNYIPVPIIEEPDKFDLDGEY